MLNYLIILIEVLNISKRSPREKKNFPRKQQQNQAKFYFAGTKLQYLRMKTGFSSINKYFLQGQLDKLNIRRHDKWVFINTLFKLYNGEGNGIPLQYSCLENPMDGKAW